jgi:hypothetical protein
MYKTVKNLFTQEIPPQPMLFKHFFALYGITESYHEEFMNKSYEIIHSELKKYRVNINDLKNISILKNVYEKWGELLLGSYNYIRETGYDKFKSPNINYLIQEVGMLYWIMRKHDLFYSFTINDLSEFDKSNEITWVNLDKVIIKEISYLANNNNLIKAKKLYNALINFKNDNFSFTISQNLGDNELPNIHKLIIEEDYD